MTSTQENPILEMRESLPQIQQDFLKQIERGPLIKSYCVSNSNLEVAEHYNNCLLNLKAFRDKHLVLVSRYIVTQKKINSPAVGTGGTNLIPFLKQVRDETLDAIISISNKN